MLLSDVRCLEHPTLKVPYESLNKRFRTAQRTIEKESSAVTAVLDAAERNIESGGDAREELSALAHRLEALFDRGGAAVDETRSAVDLFRARLEHLKDGCGKGPAGALGQWRKIRVERMLVEHFLRSGFYDSARKLAGDAGIAELTNIDLFLVAKEVEEALLRRETGRCLAWCHENRSKLRKLKSTLEFNVRLQEFIELVKRRQRLEAVAHARKHLSAAGEADNLGVVQKGMALLAFPASTAIASYADMLDPARWRFLVEQFRKENYRLYQLSTQSVFTVALQAGLSSLKTQRCAKRSFSDRDTSECPICQTNLFELASQLPYAHCSQSRLICYMSGKPLNEHNQPLMLPNGYVYGEDALTAMAAENDGQIICPRTKEIYAVTDAEKVFVM